MTRSALLTFFIGLAVGGVLVTAILGARTAGPLLQLCPLPPAATERATTDAGAGVRDGLGPR